VEISTRPEDDERGTFIKYKKSNSKQWGVIELHKSKTIKQFLNLMKTSKIISKNEVLILRIENGE